MGGASSSGNRGIQMDPARVEGERMFDDPALLRGASSSGKGVMRMDLEELDESSDEFNAPFLVPLGAPAPEGVTETAAAIGEKMHHWGIMLKAIVSPPPSSSCNSTTRKVKKQKAGNPYLPPGSPYLPPIDEEGDEQHHAGCASGRRPGEEEEDEESQISLRRWGKSISRVAVGFERTCLSSTHHLLERKE